jgi:hypothetical protein
LYILFVISSQRSDDLGSAANVLWQNKTHYVGGEKNKCIEISTPQNVFLKNVVQQPAVNAATDKFTCKMINGIFLDVAQD